MMEGTLRDQERSQLKDVFQTTTDERWCVRCQAILMAHRGRRHRHIAEDLGVAVRTLQRWLRAYQAKRLAGLKLQGRPGRTAAFQPPWRQKSWGGSYKGQPVVAWIGRIGPMQSWPHSCIEPMASRSARRRCGLFANDMASGPTVRPLTTSKRSQASRGKPARTCRP
jgi:Homeodomain-like domain